MLALLLSVVVISFSGVMLPGPMFAVVLTKSHRSPWAGLQMALGHAVVEVPLILLIYFGFARFFQIDAVQLVLSLLGGGMTVWLGLSLFRARTARLGVGEGGAVTDDGIQRRDLPCNAFVAGILLSLLNPFFFLWWATLGGMLVMKFVDLGASGLSLFIVVHWMCDLAWLSFLAVLVYRTKALWGRRIQEGVFVACSLLLLGFGVWFVVSGVSLVL